MFSSSSSLRENTLANQRGKSICTIFGVMASLFLYFSLSSALLNYLCLLLSLCLTSLALYGPGWVQAPCEIVNLDSSWFGLHVKYEIILSQQNVVGRILRMALNDPPPLYNSLLFEYG